MDHDNQLSQQEFFVGLHLISKVREVCVTCSVRARQLLTRVTQGYDLPETTPAALVASASKVSYLTPQRSTRLTRVILCTALEAIVQALKEILG